MLMLTAAATTKGLMERRENGALSFAITPK
jgi:hypothetical protein